MSRLPQVSFYRYRNLTRRGAGAINMSPPRLASTPDAPALIIWSARGVRRHNLKLASIYEPVVSTLVAGVQQYAGLSNIRFSYASVTAEEIANASKITRRGDFFIWVGEAGRRYVPWANLRRRKVFSVFYQTEPLHECAFRSDVVDEIWDFSWHTIDVCRRSLQAPVQRWVPLGALPVKHSVGHPQLPPPLFFLGSFSRNMGYIARYWCIRHLASPDLLGNHGLYRRDDVWTEAEYAQLLQQHDIFLNIHKGCDPHNPITFRVTKILNAGGLVISERAYPKDENAYAGLLTFANITRDNLTGIAIAYRQIANLSSAERKALAAERHRIFGDRFAPARIFKRAAIYELFDKMLMPNSSTRKGRRSGQQKPDDALVFGTVVNDRPTMQNAVFATVSFGGFPPSWFLPFICSFLKHVPDALLVLFVRPASAVSVFNPPHPRIKLVPWPASYNHSRFTQVFRYNVYADYLRGPEGRTFYKVAVSDASDVVFQADPFVHIGPEDDLIFGNDKDIIGRSHGNKYWVVNLYGRKSLEQISMRNVSTSGYTMGRRTGMSLYLERMAAEVNRLLVPRLPRLETENWMLAKGYDQGIHIWLLYNEFLRQPRPVPVRVLQYDEVYISGAAGMRIGRDVLLNHRGVVLNMRNATISVVHQHNRMNYAVREALSCKRRRAGDPEPDYCAECQRTWRVVPRGSAEASFAQEAHKSGREGIGKSTLASCNREEDLGRASCAWVFHVQLAYQPAEPAD
jgi:hypothetical protein